MAVARYAERCASGNESCLHAGGNWRHYRGRADPYLLKRDARKARFSVITQIDPEILIIDEMLTVGDIDFQKKCRAEISAVQKAWGDDSLHVAQYG